MASKTVRLLIELHNKFSDRNFHVYYDSIAEFGNLSQLTTIGAKQTCRFCGTSLPENFTVIAHTFPEFTGNKFLVSKDECKNCNNFFSVYEKALADYGNLMRSILGIDGKKKAPKFISKNRTFEIENDGAGAIMKLNFDLQRSDDFEKLRDETGIDLDSMDKKNSVQLSLKQHPYVPLYLYKALAKIAFSIMPESEFSNGSFKEFTSWLLQRDFSFSDNEYQPYHYIYHNKLSLFRRDPFLMLFKKRAQFKGSDMPEFSFYFGYGNHIFQIFLPYYEGDKYLIRRSHLELLIIPQIATIENDKANLIWMNGFSLDKVEPSELTFQVNRK